MSESAIKYHIASLRNLQSLGYIGWVLETKRLNPGLDLNKDQYDEGWRISLQESLGVEDDGQEEGPVYIGSVSDLDAKMGEKEEMENLVQECDSSAARSYFERAGFSGYEDTSQNLSTAPEPRKRKLDLSRGDEDDIPNSHESNGSISPSLSHASPPSKKLKLSETHDENEPILLASEEQTHFSPALPSSESIPSLTSTILSSSTKTFKNPIEVPITSADQIDPKKMYYLPRRKNIGGMPIRGQVALDTLSRKLWSLLSTTPYPAEKPNPYKKHRWKNIKRKSPDPRSISGIGELKYPIPLPSSKSKKSKNGSRKRNGKKATTSTNPVSTINQTGNATSLNSTNHSIPVPAPAPTATATSQSENSNADANTKAKKKKKPIFRGKDKKKRVFPGSGKEGYFSSEGFKKKIRDADSQRKGQEIQSG